MNQDQQRSLHMLGTDFTIAQAEQAIDWTAGRRALSHQLTALGYTQRHGRQDGKRERLWVAPLREPGCDCRCHTGTCGENDMVLAERAIRLIEKIRPFGQDGMQFIVELVDRAGVDFARVAVPTSDLDDDCPF